MKGVETKSIAPKIAPESREGIKSYYQIKIEDLEVVINDKTQDLRRLEAQRNQLNAKGAFNVFFVTILSSSFA